MGSDEIVSMLRETFHFEQMNEHSPLMPCRAHISVYTVKVKHLGKKTNSNRICKCYQVSSGETKSLVFSVMFV